MTSAAPRGMRSLISATVLTKRLRGGLFQGGQLHPDHFPGGGGRGRGGFEDAGPGRGHLGIGPGRDDGGHDVAAEGRAGLEQEALVRVDGERGAVRGEAGFEGRGHLGDKSPPQVGGPRQDDFRLKFSGQFADGRGIGLFQKIRQPRVLRQVDLVSPGGEQGLGQGLHPVPQQDRGHLDAQHFGQTPGFPQEFGGHRGQLAPALLRKDPDAVGRHPGPGRQPLGLGQGQGLHLADLDAGAAEIAALADDQAFALQPQDPEGAGLHTLAAGDTSVGVKNQAHILAVFSLQLLRLAWSGLAVNAQG